MLNRQTYFIREHVGFLKLTDTYDILDPDTQEQLGIAKEKPGTMIQQWAGLAKELFTSADRYIISLNEQPSPGKAILLLAAGLAIDTVFKEKNS